MTAALYRRAIFTNIFAVDDGLDRESASFDSERDAIDHVAEWIDGIPGSGRYLGTQVTEFDLHGRAIRCRWLDLQPDAEAYIAEGIAEARWQEREAAILRSQQL